MRFNNTITLEPIPDHRHIEVNKQHYDIISLLKWVVRKKTIPHSRRTVQTDEYRRLLGKGLRVMMYELNHPQKRGEVRNKRPITLVKKRAIAVKRLERVLTKDF